MAVTSRFRVNWRGDGVRRRVDEAARKGIDDTMAAAAIEGKRSHPGWRNRTGTAEGSIAIYQPARKQGSATVGRWGSRGVNYFIFLEIKHGSALRNATDKEYPSLAQRIKEHLK